MEKAFIPFTWKNTPSVETPLNAQNLNTLNDALDEIDDRVITLDLTKADQSDLLLSLKTVAYNTTTGVFTFTYWNGNTLSVDLNIEKIPVSFSMDANGVITMTNADGTTYTADVGSLIKTYTFSNSSEIIFTVTVDASGNKTVTASIATGSITESKLQANYLADITAQANSASASAAAALLSATNSSADALLSKSYAIGDEVARPGSSTDNSKYYKEQAELIAVQTPYVGANGDWYVWNTTINQFVDSGFPSRGPKGDTGDTGATGATGTGISSIVKTGTVGLVDTYTITYTDGTTTTFNVTNGRDGQGSGDMTKAVYDSTNAVADAGGIVAYVLAHSGAGTLAGLTDVALSTLAAGQSLVYDVTAQKWINKKLSYSDIDNTPTLGTAAAKNSTSSVTQSSTALVESGAVYSAIQTLSNAISGKQDATDNNLATTSKTVVGAINEVNTAVGTTNTTITNKHKVTRFEVSTSSWASDTTSQSGTTLYKKSIALNHVYVDSPSVDIGATGVLPTNSEQESYRLLKYVTVDSTIPCLYLYSGDIPETTFYINVTGVD